MNLNATLSLLLFGTVIQLLCSSRIVSTRYDEAGERLYRQIASSDLPWEVVARSVEERDIYAMEWGSGDSTTLIIGGFHGDEMLGIQLVLDYARYLNNEQRNSFGGRVVIVPALNPDGLVRGTRTNANGVDVNRNFPTSNWSETGRSDRYNPGTAPASEPETRAAIELLARYRPQRIVSVHIPLRTVNYDGPARRLAEKMAMHNGYPVKADIGYPTPGSFGTYAGKEKKLPVITLELPSATLEEVWEPNRKALDEAIRYD